MAASEPLDRSARSGARSAWTVIAAYGLVCAASQLLWLTYAAITTESAHHYGVSVGAIGWLSEIFPLLYVVLAIPAGMLLDRWFRPSLLAGAALVALGGVTRLGGQTFAWALAGQAIVAVAQPVVLSAVGKLASEYLPAHERANGIALGSAGNFVGMVLALVLGPTIGAHGNIERLLVIEALIGVLPRLRSRSRFGEGTRQQRARRDRRWRRSLPVGDRRDAHDAGAGLRRLRRLRRARYLAAAAAAAGRRLRRSRRCAAGRHDPCRHLGCAVLPPIVERRGAERTLHVRGRARRMCRLCAARRRRRCRAVARDDRDGRRAAAGPAGDPDECGEARGPHREQPARSSGWPATSAAWSSR